MKKLLVVLGVLAVAVPIYAALWVSDMTAAEKLSLAGILNGLALLGAWMYIDIHEFTPKDEISEPYTRGRARSYASRPMRGSTPPEGPPTEPPPKP